MGLGTLALAFALSGCRQDDTAEKQALYRAVGDHVAQLEERLDDRDSTITDFMGSFDAIEANLDAIRDREERLRDMAQGEEYLGNQGDRIRRDIGMINKLMAENSAEIRSLKQRLNASGVKILGLERKLRQLDLENSNKNAAIAELRMLLQERDAEIGGLNDQLSQQELQLALQETIIEDQEATIDTLDEALHQVYVATGSMRELKSRGIVKKEGAFLGLIGGDKKLDGAIQDDEFLTMDMRESTEIPLFTKKAKLISPHPAGTYTFTQNSEGKIETLEILDVDRFWATSRYLVVATN